MLPEEAIVLAGGFGTRLRAVVSDVPNRSRPWPDAPSSPGCSTRWSAAGCGAWWLATGYLGEMVEAAIGARHGAMEIAYVREEAPLAPAARSGRRWRRPRASASSR